MTYDAGAIRAWNRRQDRARRDYDTRTADAHSDDCSCASCKKRTAMRDYMRRRRAEESDG